MGVIRDRINAKLRSRRGAKSVSGDSVTEKDSAPPTPPSEAVSVANPTTPSPSTFTSSQLPSLPRRRLPALPGASTASLHSRSTTQDTSTRIRRLLRSNRPSSRASTASSHLEDVPEPQPTLLPAGPINTQIQDYPPDTPLTDGYISTIIPPAWHAVRADDAIYLLSGQGVGFVKAVHPARACEVLLQVSRLSVMSQVLVRSSPVWIGCEATVEYFLEGGFGIGIASFKNGFDAGATVFAVCAPNDKRKLLWDAVECIRRSAKVIKLPEDEEKQNNGTVSKKANGEDSNEKNDGCDGGHGKTQSGCVLQ